MSSIAGAGDSLLRYSKTALFTILALGAVAAATWAVVFGIMNWHRGIYAGMHGNDAQLHMENALIVQYGKAFTAQLRYADPPVVKTHLNNVLTGTGQVRIYHLIGPRGVHYCVDVWSPGNYWSKPDKGGTRINIGAKTLITRGCKF